MKDPRFTLRHVYTRAGESGEIVRYAQWSFFLDSQETAEPGNCTPWLADVEIDAIQVLESIAKRRRDEVIEGRPFACMWG